ncbi:MAG TPA: cation:proton antiporter [Acidobacteriaceae bacterium]|nr:cation:proton antiporter [Acidobacteriaceae bacterium]
MPIFALLSTLVCLAAAFTFVSRRYLRLPATVGVMLLSLGMSAVVAVAGHAVPGLHERAAGFINHINFSAVVLHGMLAFLLFAGALNLNLSDLAKQKAAVAALATFGTLFSAVLVALSTKGILSLTGFTASFVACLLFGALISPTDPIAVLEMLRRVGAPAQLEAQLTGESLFNDGVGAVLFLTLLESFNQGKQLSVGSFTWHLLIESGGGVGLGLGLGYIVYRLLRSLDSYRTEVLLTLALAMGGYAIADALHLSAPLEAVASGLVVGGRARALAMSPTTRDHVDDFWDLVDTIMNVILFLLLGLELLAMPWKATYVYAGLLAIPVVLGARWLSVVTSLGMVRAFHKPARGAISVLTWGGLRGGLAVALALALPAGTLHNQLLAITYVIVVFSVVVQGLTMTSLLRRLGLSSPAERFSHS